MEEYPYRYMGAFKNQKRKQTKANTMKYFSYLVLLGSLFTILKFFYTLNQQFQNLLIY